MCFIFSSLADVIGGSCSEVMQMTSSGRCKGDVAERTSRRTTEITRRRRKGFVPSTIKRSP